MRAISAALTLPLLSLAACGGGGAGGAVSVGTSAPPAGPTGGTPTPTPTPAPTAQNMFDVTTATTFDVVGAFQSMDVDAKNATLYRAKAAPVDAPNGTINYDPRDGVFTVILNDSLAGISKNIRFQDPMHRSDSDDARRKNMQVPLLTGFNYLQALEGTANFTFFYQRPGTSGSFVSLAGFERTVVNDANKAFTSEQGVMVFGTRTTGLQVPRKGTGRYEGQLLATMAANIDGSAPVLQWITGTSAADVDFAKRTVGLSLNGVVGEAFRKTERVNDDALAIPSGSIFTATGSANWADAGTVFAGKFSSAGFKVGADNFAIDFTSVGAGTSTAGASSIDGTFYGPDAKNIGGNFRIVGGIPNQRVDILGAFAGAKK